MSNSKSGREDRLLSILSVYTEYDFARIYHVELASCHTLDIGVVFAELLLGFDLSELLAERFGLRDKGTVLCLETCTLLHDVGETRDAEDRNDNNSYVEQSPDKGYAVCLVMNLTQFQEPAFQ